MTTGFSYIFIFVCDAEKKRGHIGSMKGEINNLKCSIRDSFYFLFQIRFIFPSNTTKSKNY